MSPSIRRLRCIASSALATGRRSISMITSPGRRPAAAPGALSRSPASSPARIIPLRIKAGATWREASNPAGRARGPRTMVTPRPTVMSMNQASPEPAGIPGGRGRAVPTRAVAISGHINGAMESIHLPIPPPRVHGFIQARGGGTRGRQWKRGLFRDLWRDVPRCSILVVPTGRTRGSLVAAAGFRPTCLRSTGATGDCWSQPWLKARNSRCAPSAAAAVFPTLRRASNRAAGMFPPGEQRAVRGDRRVNRMLGAALTRGAKVTCRNAESARTGSAPAINVSIQVPKSRMALAPFHWSMSSSPGRNRLPPVPPACREDHATLTSICLGFALSLLATCTLSTPSLNSAFTLFASASSGSVKLRAKLP